VLRLREFLKMDQGQGKRGEKHVRPRTAFSDTRTWRPTTSRGKECQVKWPGVLNARRPCDCDRLLNGEGGARSLVPGTRRTTF
jgi:hypothetical protein